MSDPDHVEHRVFKAKLPDIDPAIMARLRTIAAMEPSFLPTDPKVIADDLQTAAALALHTHDNVEILIQLLQEMGKAGTLMAEPPEKPPKRGRM